MRESSAGARYGIWGVDPNTDRMSGAQEMLLKSESPFDRALKTASGVQNLFGDYYKNKLANLNSQFKQGELQEQQGTLQQKIQALNSKYGADTKFYPLQQEANLGHTKAMIDEVMSKTGLNRAQATEAIAHAGEYGAMAGLHRANTGLVGTQNEALGNWLKDQRMGSKRSGAGGTYTDQNTGQVISTDTNAQTSRDQKAIAGTENVKQYLKTVVDTLPQYQTGEQQAGLGLKKISNYALGTNYTEPSEYAKGQAAVKSAAEGFLNTFQLNSTGENVNKAIDIMTPKFGESPEGAKARIQKELSDFVEQEGRAKGRLSGGTDVTPNEDTRDINGTTYVKVGGKWHTK